MTSHRRAPSPIARDSRRGSFVRVARQGLAPLAIAGALLLLSLYGLHLARSGPGNGSRADFGSGYTAATIIRNGDAHQVYDLRLQGAVGNRVLAPAHITLPFYEIALGAVVLVPLTALPLQDAFIVWTTVQFLLVLLGVVIAVRATPSAVPRSILAGAAITGIAATSVALDNLMGVGQWTGVNALGLAMAYRCWRRGSYAWGGAWLIASAALFKPHLAFGLMAFLLGWGNRRALLGAASTGVAAVAAMLALVGTDGMRAMLTNGVQLNAEWSQRGGASFIALPSMWFADGRMTYVVGFAGGCVCLLLCALLGRRLRRDRSLLGPALAAAAALSLLASPHSYLFDEMMLAPAVAWSLAELGLFAMPQRRGLDSAWTIVVLWAAAPWIQVVFNGAVTPLVERIGVLFVWFTIALAAAFWSIPRETHARLRRAVVPGALPVG